MYIYNGGIMPDELSSIEKLFTRHSSKPFNPRLAGIFFKSGMVETWCRGFELIKDTCESHGTPLPEYEILSYGVMAHCKPYK
jgi:ATP-dependent DNA helicase RecG